MSIKGRLKDMSLVDIIQVFNAERRTVGIHLGSDMGYGQVYMREGELVHSSYRDLFGAEALWQLLVWEDGDFEVVQKEAAPAETITDPVEALMLEGMRRIDESRRKGIEPKGYSADTESSGLIEKLLELGIIEKTEKR
jgi:hypothetical protein